MTERKEQEAVVSLLEKATVNDDDDHGFILTAPTAKGEAVEAAGEAPSSSPPPPSWIKAALEWLRTRELAWLRGLPIKDQERLNEATVGPTFPAHHITFSGEIVLCLLGLKPCVEISHGLWDLVTEAKRPCGGDGRTFASEHKKHVLEPWAAEFRPERYGFVLTILTSAAAPSVEIPNHTGFKGSTLFYNTRDPSAPLVKSVFLSGKDRVSNKLIG